MKTLQKEVLVVLACALGFATGGCMTSTQYNRATPMEAWAGVGPSTGEKPSLALMAEELRQGFLLVTFRALPSEGHPSVAEPGNYWRFLLVKEGHTGPVRGAGNVEDVGLYALDYNGDGELELLVPLKFRGRKGLLVSTSGHRCWNLFGPYRPIEASRDPRKGELVSLEESPPYVTICRPDQPVTQTELSLAEGFADATLSQMIPEDRARFEKYVRESLRPGLAGWAIKMAGHAIVMYAQTNPLVWGTTFVRTLMFLKEGVHLWEDLPLGPPEDVYDDTTTDQHLAGRVAFRQIRLMRLRGELSAGSGTCWSNPAVPLEASLLGGSKPETSAVAVSKPPVAGAPGSRQGSTNPPAAPAVQAVETKVAAPVAKVEITPAQDPLALCSLHSDHHVLWTWDGACWREVLQKEALAGKVALACVIKWQGDFFYWSVEGKWVLIPPALVPSSFRQP